MKFMGGANENKERCLIGGMPNGKSREVGWDYQIPDPKLNSVTVCNCKRERERETKTKTKKQKKKEKKQKAPNHILIPNYTAQNGLCTLFKTVKLPFSFKLRQREKERKLFRWCKMENETQSDAKEEVLSVELSAPPSWKKLVSLPPFIYLFS